MFKKLIELRQQKAEKVAEMRSMLEKAEKENKIIRCRKLTVKLTNNREER